ncbi:hypothetical protein M9H77_30455 [Catharanthus roseus]|uniref:Uncharacterized protein n=1 Tax=Catharanthus roseus TaxID=4058 RepID=A0ACB9ZZK6_CATRO|nr:hypothetical protein M9H77_30455 [Catharanthus roseus]
MRFGSHTPLHQLVYFNSNLEIVNVREYNNWIEQVTCLGIRIIAPDLLSSDSTTPFSYRGRSTVEGLAQSVFMLTSHHALRWVGHLVESQEGLETKVGLRADLLLWNRALVRCLTGINYETPELGSDDLILGSGLCMWKSTIALHVLLNSGIEAALMCLDSLRLPNCVQTRHFSAERHANTQPSCS